MIIRHLQGVVKTDKEPHLLEIPTSREMSIMPHLLRYRELAVVHYSGIPCALHLRHARQSLNLGKKNIVIPAINLLIAGVLFNGISG